MIPRRNAFSILIITVGASVAWAGPVVTTSGGNNASNAGGAIAGAATDTNSSGVSNAPAINTDSSLITPHPDLATASLALPNAAPNPAAMPATPLGLSGPSSLDAGAPSAPTPAPRASNANPERKKAGQPPGQVQVLRDIVQDVSRGVDANAKLAQQYSGSAAKDSLEEPPVEDFTQDAKEWRMLPRTSDRTYQLSDIPGLLNNARSVDAYSAPGLYAQILDILKDKPAQAMEIRREALGRILPRKRGSGAMQALLQDALAAAASSDPKARAKAKKLTQAIYAWAGLFYPSGWRSFLDDTVLYSGREVGLAEMIKDISEGRLNALHADNAKPSFSLRFDYVTGGAFGRMSVRIEDPSARFVPESWLSRLMLPSSFISSQEQQGLLGAAAMRGSFDLAPNPDFKRNFRRQRALGRSVWSSFWLSARQYIADSGSALARMLRILAHWWMTHFGRFKTVAGLAVAPNLEQLRTLPSRPIPGFAH